MGAPTFETDQSSISKIAAGEVTALVSGSSLYKVSVRITTLAPPRWEALCSDCSGAIDSLVELLQAKFSKGIMERMCRQESGLFPSPAEIRLSCSCPDWADMCKHVAAVLYGVGARLDERPELLFQLRNVDHSALIATAGKDFTIGGKTPNGRVLDGSDLSALFDIDLAMSSQEPAPMEAIAIAQRPAPRHASRKTTGSGEAAQRNAAPRPRKASPAKLPKSPVAKAAGKRSRQK